MDLVLNSCTDKMSSWSVVLLNGEHRVWPRLKRVNGSLQLNALSSLNLITVSASAGHCHTVIADSLEGFEEHRHWCSQIKAVLWAFTWRLPYYKALHIMKHWAKRIRTV